MESDTEGIREHLLDEIERDGRDIDGLVEMLKSLTNNGKENACKAAAECCMAYYRKWDIYHAKTKLYIELFRDNEGSEENEWVDKEHDFSKEMYEEIGGLYQGIADSVLKEITGTRLLF